MLSSSFAQRGFAKLSAEKLRPLFDRILVERVKVPEKTNSGIFLPDSVKQKHNEGYVIAVGPGSRGNDGNYNKLNVKAGDRVVLGSYFGHEVEMDGREYMVLREDDILGVIQE